MSVNVLAWRVLSDIAKLPDNAFGYCWPYDPPYVYRWRREI